jgi:hypothetical protein
MPEAKLELIRVPTLKTAGNFRNHLVSLGVSLPCDDDIETSATSPLNQSVERVLINGKRLGTAPRHGLVSGCYPFDKHYSTKPVAEKLKALKKIKQKTKRAALQ